MVHPEEKVLIDSSRKLCYIIKTKMLKKCDVLNNEMFATLQERENVGICH